VSLPIMKYRIYRNADRSPTITDSIAERIHRLCLMFPGQAKMVVRPIDLNVFFMHRPEAFTDGIEKIFATFLTHFTIREINMHTGTIPITENRFWMDIYFHSIFF